jgi:hypothetical protein
MEHGIRAGDFFQLFDRSFPSFTGVVLCKELVLVYYVACEGRKWVVFPPNCNSEQQ